MSVLSRLREKFPVLVPSKVKAKVRVAIAKDVVEILGVGRMVVADGDYFTLDTWAEGVDESYESIALSIRQPRSKTSCTVCAIGAAALCAAGLYDEIDHIDYYEYGIDPYQMRDLLAKWFSRQQLDLIECAFEFSVDFAEGGSSEQAREKAKRFGLEYDYASERLEAIMGNIVQNGGSFRP